MVSKDVLKLILQNTNDNFLIFLNNYFREGDYVIRDMEDGFWFDIDGWITDEHRETYVGRRIRKYLTGKITFAGTTSLLEMLEEFEELDEYIDYDNFDMCHKWYYWKDGKIHSIDDYKKLIDFDEFVEYLMRFDTRNLVELAARYM